MDMNGRNMLVWGCSLAGLGVAAGAFGAHALADRLDASDLATFETAVRYQLYHALALVGCAGLSRGSTGLRAPAWCFVFGSIVFSGSLYGMVLTGARWLGAVTPVGGTLFLFGWLLVALRSKIAWASNQPA